MNYPAKLFTEIRRAAFERDVPVRQIILEALRDAGFEVSEDEMEDRRGANMREGRTKD